MYKVEAMNKLYCFTINLYNYWSCTCIHVPSLHHINGKQIFSHYASLLPEQLVSISTHKPLCGVPNRYLHRSERDITSGETYGINATIRHLFIFCRRWGLVHMGCKLSVTTCAVQVARNMRTQQLLWSTKIYLLPRRKQMDVMTMTYSWRVGNFF